MKKGLVLVAVLLAVVAPPAVAQAQGLFGFGLPGNILGPYGGTGQALFTPPAFYVGWMESYKDTVLLFDAAPPGGFLGGSHKWPSAGLWLGLAETVNLTQRCGVMVDGWVLIPSDRKGSEPETSLTTILVFNGETFDPVQLTSLGKREWDTRNDWWYVDGMLFCGCSKTFQALAGFRYEHFSTRFKNPSDAVVVPSTPSDRLDITVNSYLPYFGAQYATGGSNSSLSVRFLGFPFVPANATHFETGEAGSATRIESKGNFRNGGYWWELFAEYDWNMFNGASVGAFLRWNVVHGKAKFHSELQPAHIIGQDQGATFDRNTFTFGGSLSLNFGSPW